MGKSDIDTAVEDETGKKGDEGKRDKRIDLSLTQVLGSAVATVVAAFLAGQLGVYGTFIGAGVVSLMATSGGPIFQHVFRRTGEQIKEATVQAKPKTRRLPVQAPPQAGPGTRREPWPDDDATRVMPQGPVSPPDQVQMLDTSQVTRMLPNANTGTGEYPGHREDDATTVLRAAGPQGTDEEFTRATTHGTKWRGWKRTLLPAVLVFVIAIGGITLFEAVSGKNVAGGKGTSIGHMFQPSGYSGSGSGGDGPETPKTTPSPGQSGNGGEHGEGDGDGSTGDRQPSGDPSADPDSGDTGRRGGSGDDSGSGSTPTPTPSKQQPSDRPTEQPTEPDGTGDPGDGDQNTGDGQGGAGAGGLPQAPAQQPDADQG